MANASNPGGKILFVDDSRLMRFSAQKCLAEQFDVVLAEDGESAIRALADDPAIRCVVTDLMMPGVDGFGVIQHIRNSEDKRLREVPVMALTGSESAEDRRRAIELGANEMMTKPFRPPALLDRVSQLLAVEPAPKPRTSTIEVPSAINVERDRAGFLGRLLQAMALHLRQDLPISLLQVRLNAVRVENGSRVKLGDSVLKAIMRQIEKVLITTVRIEDTVGRTGSDHRTLLLPGTSAQGARALRERIHKAVADYAFELQGHRLDVKLDIYLHVPDKSIDPEQLIAYVPSDGDDDSVFGQQVRQVNE